jgi:anti-sigma B factor antagonist
MLPYRVEVSTDAEHPVVSVAGELDLAAAPVLIERAMQALQTPTCRSLTIELAGVTFADSTTLGALVTIRNTSIALDKALVLTNVSARLLRLFELTGLRDVFEIGSES